MVCSKLHSQEVQFSQFYAAPVYLNPAFAGNTIQDRIAMSYRSQWNNVPGAFKSYALSYDKSFIESKSGVGIVVVGDKAGSAGLSYTNVSGNYSYVLSINRKLAMRFGLGAAYASRSIDQSKLVFGSQIVQNTANTTFYNFTPRNYVDISSGVVIYSWDYWAGVSAQHINRPNQGLTHNTNYLYQLPMSFTFHGGYNIPIKKDNKKRVTAKLTPLVNYKMQQKWSQLDIGLYYTRSILVVGSWYRGIPLKKNPDENAPIPHVNQDALVLLLGLDLKSFKLGYTHDVTISKLAGNTSGSNEVSLIYELASKKKRNSYRRFLVPCAKF